MVIAAGGPYGDLSDGYENETAVSMTAEAETSPVHANPGRQRAAETWLATIHLLTVGTDRYNMALRVGAAMSTAVATFLLAYRVIAPKPAKPQSRRVPVA